MLQGEQVPADEKLVSLFEPETAVIRKGKLSKPTEYGRMIWLDEVEGGIISRYEVLVGNPSDSLQVQPSIAQHHRLVLRPQTWTRKSGLRVGILGSGLLLVPQLLELGWCPVS